MGFFTHQCGNILDLVITEVESKFDIIRGTLGLFISDHKAVVVKTGLQKEKLEVSELCMRKIAIVTLDELNKNVCMDSVNLDAELSSICNQYLSHLQKVFDTVTPEKKVKLLKRRGTPGHGMIVTYRNNRKLSEIVKDSHWQAYKGERYWYNNMLTYKRKKQDLERNSGLWQRHKKLYQLLNNITGSTSTNAMQEGMNDQELTELFADYFHQHIENQRFFCRYSTLPIC